MCVPKAFQITVWDILTDVEKTELITPVDTLLSKTFFKPETYYWYLPEMCGNLSYECKNSVPFAVASAT